MRPRLNSIVTQVLGPAISEAETDAFLKARKARITLQAADSQSFHARLLGSTTEIDTFGQHLQLRINQSTRETMHVLLHDKVANKTLLEASVNVTDNVESLSVEIDNMVLIIELDAAPDSSTAY